jgi:hypothetical protein
MRKPIIYIFTPSVVNVSVTLSLIPELRLSAIYPVVPIKRLVPAGEQVQWNVRASPGGCLTEADTGLETSYLFWEAE